MKWSTGKCPRIATDDVVFYDCEFIPRGESYLSLRLCLVQLYQSAWPQVALLEPQEAPWKALQDCTLVMHHFEADTQLFSLHAGAFPRRILDTQMGYAFLQPQARIAYADLVGHYLQLDLSKSEKRSAWHKRPLSWAQKNYAAADVYYLAHLYPHLCEDLQAVGRLQWWEEECQAQLQRLQEKRFEWFNLRHAPILFQQEDAARIASALTRAREEMAIQLRCHRDAILRDEDIVMMAQWLDEDKVLQALQDYAPLLRSEQEAIMEALQQPPPRPKKRPRPLNYREARWVEQALERLPQLAQELGLSSMLLANKQDVMHWILRLPNRLEQGWRAPIFADWERPT